ncbi:MAG: ribonuclease D [Geminicoccaceae bacterium]|nr:ribonuclease D [Geminicoccaceae bacterium]
MTINVHEGDLPDGLTLGLVVAIDTETMGLNPARDRLCVVQLTDGGGACHLVRLPRQGPQEAAPFEGAPNLTRLLADPERLKLFHFARFDVAALRRHFGVVTAPVWCTKIASKLVRTYTDRHGLKDLCRELLGVDLVKTEQSSDWGADTLSEAQTRYAAQDVLHLHALKEGLEAMLRREERLHLAEACFAFLPVRAELDLKGWGDADIFAH